VPPDRVSSVLSAHTPDVALLNLAAECRQMIGLGATACLAQSTEARDVLHAIHLASRGLRILPPAGPDTYEPSGPAPLAAREADVLELLQGDCPTRRSPRH